jgi:hypothetical protein
MVKAAVPTPSIASRIESVVRSCVASDFSRRSSRASRNRKRHADRDHEPAEDVGPHVLDAVLLASMTISRYREEQEKEVDGDRPDAD